jgi:ATP-dependent RNA helicase RhlE
MSEITPGFHQFKLNKQLLLAIEEAGYTEPTSIQEQAIPRIQAGHDLFGVAQTGTGKTAAYLIPVLMRLKYAKIDHPRALVLVPTRELAMQVSVETEKLGQYQDLRTATFYGGVNKKKQVRQLEGGTDIIVSTPGRLLDIYTGAGLSLRHVEVLVLDEADRMMDMGFLPQINNILELVSIKKRQNLLFSATLPDKVKKLAEDFLEFPEVVEVTPQSTTAETVQQYQYRVPNLKSKINLLVYMLAENDIFSRVMVFVKTKATANNLYKYLERKKIGEVRAIHGNKDLNARINGIKSLENGDIRILVATDVVARGIDVSALSHVINFDVPLMYEDYVHRIGRTGRARMQGEAITFVNPAEEYHMQKIEELIHRPVEKVLIPDAVEITSTPFEEQQLLAREIDEQKKKDNPDFKGAFHKKKRSFRTGKTDRKKNRKKR